MKLTPDGRIVIPEHILKMLGWDEHTEVNLRVNGTVLEVRDVAALRARLTEGAKDPSKRLTTDEVMALTRGED